VSAPVRRVIPTGDAVAPHDASCEVDFA